MNDVDLNKVLIEKNPKNTTGVQRPVTAASDCFFTSNQKAFFGIDKGDTASEWNRNAHKFFDDGQKAQSVHGGS